MRRKSLKAIAPTLDRGTRRSHGAKQRPWRLNGCCGLRRIGELGGFVGWFGVPEALAAFGDARPKRKAGRLYASVWMTRLAARLLGRRIDRDACELTARFRGRNGFAAIAPSAFLTSGVLRAENLGNIRIRFACCQISRHEIAAGVNRRGGKKVP